MKLSRIKFYLIIIIALTLNSCKKNNNKPLTINSNTIENDSIKVGNLIIKMREGYDPKILTFNENDWSNYYQKHARNKNFNQLSIDDLDSISKPIINQFIDVSEVDSLSKEELNEVSKEFGGISKEEIEENSAEIIDYYNKLMQFQIVETLVDLRTTKGAYEPDYIKFTTLNLRETLIISRRPALISEYKKAAITAWDYTKKNWSSFYKDLNFTDNRADAYRHIIWNYLLCKYFADPQKTIGRITNITECTNYVKELTDAHENYTNNELSHAMDFHNNYIGRYLFETKANYKKSCLFCITRLICPSETEISNIIFYQKCSEANNIKCKNIEEINSQNSITAVRVTD
jgi:hypothetical protein